MPEAQCQTTGAVISVSDTRVFARIANITTSRTDVEERDYEKEMKRRWTDIHTAHMRLLKVGHRIEERYDGDMTSLEYYGRLDATGRVRLFSKVEGESYRALKNCHFPDAVFDEPTTEDYEVLRPKLLYLRMQIANLETTERAGVISRMEADIISRSSKCRRVAITIADAFRYVLEKQIEPWPGWNFTMHNVSSALDLVERLQVKFQLPSIYYFRVTAALAARQLLLTWHSLPFWFTLNPCHIDTYIKMYDEFAMIGNTTVRRRNTLNYAAVMSGHPKKFQEVVFQERFDLTQGPVVKSVQDLQVLTAASIIAGPLFEETLQSLLTEA
ncbi:unnamed protein product [Zymoseptoria tritici ST99CH_3D1]|uniref:Uncharacterized protein n=1 Tax=Zymoseptoria tritici ST99CH_1E4 TaxID=1276532 RepID=A0A2H1G401_ZYMTR|nr:unnamed protein product [Zymoseptoria tritici ST99CH_1E4]SMR49493.1 unnamed protein product [Zymoseptoria tritici ST99CH_3D1]